MSMDIELAEPQALAGFSIGRFNPSLVAVEAHPPVRQQILDYFARNQLRPRRALLARGRPQFLVRTAWTGGELGGSAVAMAFTLSMKIPKPKLNVIELAILVAPIVVLSSILSYKLASVIRGWSCCRSFLATTAR